MIFELRFNIFRLRAMVEGRGGKSYTSLYPSSRDMHINGGVVVGWEGGGFMPRSIKIK